MNLSLRSVRRAITIGAVALAAVAAAPQAASASVSCSYDAGGHWVSVKLDADGDRAQIAVDPALRIAVGGLPCGAATVGNTDSIFVGDLSAGGATKVAIDASSRSFGAIEWVVGLGGGSDTLAVLGGTKRAAIVLGTDGINLNADELGADADVSLFDVDNVHVFGGPGPDWISGHGGAGTSNPYTGALSVYGGAGDDELEGGEIDNWQTYLDAGAGDDLLVAGSKGAGLMGGAGDDTIVGGAGLDEAVYTHAPSGVQVDLAAAGPQDTGGAGIDTISGVEMVGGSDFGDVLKGDELGNGLYGGWGDDVLEGGGGADDLDGNKGADMLRPGAGNGDVLEGGDGEDTAAYDDQPAPVSVDLRLDGVAQHPQGAGAQTLHGIEGVLGSPFADRLVGSAGANAIDGGAGADVIDGGEGADRLAGGAGIDAIESRDASADSVSCGEGPDNLAVDPLDTVAPDCAPPPPGGGDGLPGGDGQPGGSEPSAPVLTVRVPRQSLRSALTRGLRVELTCSAACRASGRLTLPRAVATRLGIGRRAASRIGRLAPVDLAAAAPVARRIRLSRAARAAARGARVLRVSLRAHAVDGAGRAAAPVRRTVRLRAR